MTTSKTVLVTRVNCGVGYEVCRQFGREGYQFILTARNPDDGMRAVEELRSETSPITFKQLDISDARFIRHLFNWTLAICLPRLPREWALRKLN